MMDGWIPLCALEDIPRLGSRVVKRARGPAIALFRTASDRVFALDDRCPHRGGPLSQGLVTGEHIVCPLHGWTIAMIDGRAVAPDEGCTQRYAVQIREGRVHLRVEDVTGADVAPVTLVCG